ncbi:MAG: tetratricopeptide repeat protein [Ramlibacter sp.]|nr:tetratricopeptide repeat protein [Ramlibacter sp.]
MNEHRAKVAARVMSSSSASKASVSRQWLLLSVMLLLAAALATFWWWVDAGTSGPGSLARRAPVLPMTTPEPLAAQSLDTSEKRVQPVAPPEPVVGLVPGAAPAVTASDKGGGIGQRSGEVRRRPGRSEGEASIAGPTKTLANASVAKSSPSSLAIASGPVLRRTAPAELNRMQTAYSDFNAGRTEAAAQIWRDVLRTEPLQRDAWLGLAVLAHREGRRDEAIASYRQVLRIDPENAAAIAALSVLTNATADPQEESRLRDLLASNPNSAMLNGALARVLAAQGRWDEAQPLWFAAHAREPDNPSLAFNLAVALDRLRKPALAAEYYRKALALNEGRPDTFDANAARKRLAGLSAALEAATKP